MVSQSFFVAALQGNHPGGLVLATAGAVGGFAVGISGMGGGALMTPLLVLLLRVDPRVAIASDLASSLIMKPVGGVVHARRGTIHWGLVARLVTGSVPAAFVGSWLLGRLGGRSVQGEVKLLLGAALIMACLCILARAALTARTLRRLESEGRAPNPAPYRVKTVPTVAVGAVGGLMVGMTSVGSGSLMIVLLMLLYPRLSSRSLVGTDLVQAVPLVASAVLGQFLFGHVDLALAGALVAGSVPGVWLGARVSSRSPDWLVRPALVLVLCSSGLALLFGGDDTGLALAIATVVVVGASLWAAVDATTRPTACWEAARWSRTTWVALMGVGAPFGVGLLASVVYVTVIRPAVMAAEASARSPVPR